MYLFPVSILVAARYKLSLVDRVNRSKKGRKMFESNKHGHSVVRLIGYPVPAEYDIDHKLMSGRFGPGRLSDIAFEYLLSSEYEDTITLLGLYTLAVVPMKAIAARKSTELAPFMEEYSYQKIRAGIMSRLCDALSKADIEAMGFEEIIGYHDPLKDCFHAPFASLFSLCSVRGDEIMLSTCAVHNFEQMCDGRWGDVSKYGVVFLQEVRYLEET